MGGGVGRGLGFFVCLSFVFFGLFACFPCVMLLLWFACCMPRMFGFPCTGSTFNSYHPDVNGDNFELQPHSIL